jgi:hypothetical protein
MQTGLGKMQRLTVGEVADFKGLYAIKERSGRIGAIGIFIAQRAGGTGGVPLLATGHAGMTTHTDI